MLTEDYCSYEVAKLLKEKGFSEKCIACYNWIDNSLRTIYRDTTGEVEPQDWNNLTFEEAGKIGLASWYRNISAPTHQMAMKWLREKGVFIGIDVNIVVDNTEYLYHIYINTEKRYVDRYISGYDTYEEAVEAALKYSLENLI